MTMVDRPNQEMLLRAMNMYRDAMRSYILTALVQSHGPASLKDAIINSLSDEQTDNFERDLDRNDGNIEATLDVNHFAPIVSHYWDSVFAARFGHDRTMQGTLRWITLARNDASHPGTADITAEDMTGHLNNILKTLYVTGPFDAVRRLEEMKGQVTAHPVSARSASEQASDEGITASSVCANSRCRVISEHRIASRGAGAVKCPKCSTSYRVNIGTAISMTVRTEEDKRGRKFFVHALRFRFPDGDQMVHDIALYQSLHVDPGDSLTFTGDEQGRVSFLLFNRTINRWWIIANDPSLKQRKIFLWIGIAAVAMILFAASASGC